jgi:uncharacterized protein (UPF0335 family)
MLDPDDGEEPKRDFAKMFDLDRPTAIKNFVGEMENRMRDIETAQSDLKAIVEAAKEAEFTAREVAAMRTVAKLRLKDKKGEAREKLEALERIGKAVGFDLFDWASARS